MNFSDKRMRLIGLARRAGKVSYGFLGVLEDIKKHKSKLIIFARDISPKTKKEIEMDIGRLPVLELPLTKEQLGNLIGTKPTAVISINDSNFKEGILEVS